MPWERSALGAKRPGSAAKGGADAVEEADEGTKGEQWQVRGVGVGRRLRRESGGARVGRGGRLEAPRSACES